MTIVFYSEYDKPAKVDGSEQSAAWLFSAGLLAAVLRINGASYETAANPSPLRRVFDAVSLPPAPHHDLVRDLHTMLIGDIGLWYADNKREQSGVVAANTVMVTCSTETRLRERLIMQCADHCYIEGRHRLWVADVIKEGVRNAILRKEMGWLGVIRLLRSRTDTPVVVGTPSNVFPSMAAAEWDDEQRWLSLTHSQRWSLATTKLRMNNAYRSLHLNIDPDNQEGVRFGSGVTGYHVRAYADAFVRER